MVGAVLVAGSCLALLLVAAYCVAFWSMPDRPAVCGQTVRLSTGADALVVCDEDDAPRGDTP
jgi:hypothetical protein